MSRGSGAQQSRTGPVRTPVVGMDDIDDVSLGSV
jgi:hypothetical protein